MDLKVPHPLTRLQQILDVRRTPVQLLSVLALLCVIVLNLFWARPFYNWDLIAYVGVVHSYTQKSPSLIHARTYSEIQEHVPTTPYRRLLGEGHSHKDYRAAMAKSPEEFVAQLPFYSVKPLYPSLMFLLNQTGIDLVTASVLISRVSYLLIGILLWYWIARYYPPLTSFLLASLLISMPFSLALARYSTPDALSSLILLLAFFLFIEHSRTRLATVILVLSIAARPDNVMLVTLLALYDLVFRKEERLFSLGVMLAAFSLYKLLTTLSGNYGWPTLFYFAHVSFLTNPASDPIHFSAIDYLKVLIRKSQPVNIGTTSYSLIVFFLLAILAAQLQWTGRFVDNRKFQLLAVTLLFVCAHWITYPSQKERLLAGWFLFVLVMLTTSVQERTKASNAAANDRLT